MRGDVPVGASMANFVAPERPRGTRLMNRTMQEVMEDWDYQAGRQREAVERGRKDRRFDPVTETYY